MEQVWGAIGAVFGSLDERPRAIVYRRHVRHPRRAGARPSTCRRWSSATWATTRGTGVAFTRDPATGENVFYGEYLINAQGEDVVAGIRTPQPIERRSSKDMPDGLQASSIEDRQTLEKHYRDVQDIEFTIQHGKL